MKYSVSSFPSVRVFNGEDVYTYTGKPKKKKIILLFFIFLGKFDSASIKLFIGQGISSFHPIGRSEFDPSGISSVFFHQINLSSLNLQTLFNYLLQHKIILLISMLFITFFFGIFVGKIFSFFLFYFFHYLFFFYSRNFHFFFLFAG
jgi:hypothetical protein